MKIHLNLHVDRITWRSLRQGLVTTIVVILLLGAIGGCAIQAAYHDMIDDGRPTGYSPYNLLHASRTHGTLHVVLLSTSRL